jgi:DNA-binding Xre family transcriptional regulator
MIVTSLWMAARPSEQAFAKQAYCFCLFKAVGQYQTLRLAGVMDLRQVFAANLRRIRHDKGLSQEDLAYAAGVNRTYMSKLEQGGSFVGLEIIGKLADVLGVRPTEFLETPPKPNRKKRA